MNETKKQDIYGVFYISSSLNRPKAPYISLVMSVYNAEKYLPEAAESVLNQTYTNFEFVILNDGSTDNSEKLLQEYLIGDSRIVLVRQANIGLTKSLNRGIYISRSKYIARQDTDDISLPLRLEKQIDYFNRHNDTAVLGTNYFLYSDNEKLRGKFVDEGSLQKQVYLHNLLVHSSIMFRRRDFIKIGLYNEQLRTSQDFEAWIRMSSLGKIRMLPEPLVIRRDHKDTVSNTRRLRQCIDSAHIRLSFPKYGYLPAIYASIRQSISAFSPRFIKRRIRRLNLINRK